MSLLLTNLGKRRGGNALLPWEGTVNKLAVLFYLLTEKQKNSERILYLRKKKKMHTMTDTKGVYKGSYTFSKIKRSFIRGSGDWICLVSYS